MISPLKTLVTVPLIVRIGSRAKQKDESRKIDTPANRIRIKPELMRNGFIRIEESIEFNITFI